MHTHSSVVHKKKPQDFSMVEAIKLVLIDDRPFFCGSRCVQAGRIFIYIAGTLPDRGITAFERPALERLVLKRLGRKLSFLEGHPSQDFLDGRLFALCLRPKRSDSPNAAFPLSGLFSNSFSFSLIFSRNGDLDLYVVILGF